MIRPIVIVLRVLVLMCLITLPAQRIGAQAPQASSVSWVNTTELTFVGTAGNASASTFGIKSALTATAALNTFKVEVGGVRAESDVRTLTAVGSADDFDVRSVSMSQLTAANYFAKARFDRDFGAAYGYTSAGWDRNTFAGVENRYAFAAGGGKTWVESDDARFKTDLAATYTVQHDVDPDPDFDNAFAGARLTVDAMKRLTSTTDLESVLILDQNGEVTEDFRSDWLTSVSVAISEGLALKTSVQILFDQQPSLKSIPLESTTGTPTGQKVLTPNKKVDRLLTLALVIKL